MPNKSEDAVCQYCESNACAFRSNHITGCQAPRRTDSRHKGYTRVDGVEEVMGVNANDLIRHQLDKHYPRPNNVVLTPKEDLRPRPKQEEPELPESVAVRRAAADEYIRRHKCKVAKGDAYINRLQAKALDEYDPGGISQHAPGAKLDAGKADMSLLQDFGLAIEAVAEVATFGADKYSRGGWQHVDDGVNRYTAAMQRHFFQERYAMLDEDSQLMHAAQVAWNALARLELIRRDMKA